MITVNDLIKELNRIKQEGKGEYKVKSSCWNDEFDLEKPVVFDEEEEVFL